MRNQIRARAQAAQRRQRLQIGGGSLLVALIWAVALWPSTNEEPTSHSVPAPRASYTPWTTGPFVGTTPTTSGTSVPTVLQSTIPTAGVPGGEAAPRTDGQGAGPAPPTTGSGTVAPSPAPTTTSRPTKKGNGTGKPPKPTSQPSPTSSEGTDLLDIFGL